MREKPRSETLVAFVGCGAVGRTLARALADAGYRIGGLVCRRPNAARAARRFVGCGRAGTEPAAACRAADVVFLATPDEAIDGVCAAVAAKGGFHAGQVVLHCSGALTSAVLRPAREAGAATGSLHPLQSFSRPDQTLASLPGTCYAFEGEARAYRAARRLVAALRGRIFRLEPEAKSLYHARARHGRQPGARGPARGADRPHRPGRRGHGRKAPGRPEAPARAGAGPLPRARSRGGGPGPGKGHAFGEPCPPAAGALAAASFLARETGLKRSPPDRRPVRPCGMGPPPRAFSRVPRSDDLSRAPDAGPFRVEVLLVGEAGAVEPGLEGVVEPPAQRAAVVEQMGRPRGADDD